MTGPSREPVRLAGATLGKHRHICALFHSPEERYRIMLPFIKEGLDRGEHAFHIVDPNLRGEHRQRLQSAGVDVPAAEGSGQFDLHDWDDTYVRDGNFDKDKMLALVEAGLEEPGRRGYSLSRMVCQLDWAADDRTRVNDLLEYEARFNYISPRYPHPVVCTYELTRFGADVVIDVMRTHPMIIIGGILQENPFFVPPDEFLRELQGREAKSKVAQP